METFLNILPWALAILAGVLYYFSRQKAKKAEFLETHSDTLQKMLEKKEVENIQINKEFTALCNELTDVKILVRSLRDESNKYKRSIESLESEKLDLEAKNTELRYDYLTLKDQLDDPSKNSKAVDLRLFIEKYEDYRFVNSAVINLHTITLKDIELIHENHIKVIRSLAGKGYFREDLAVKFNYNPKTGTIDFNLIEFDDESPIRAKDWKELLTERRQFIDTITQYIEGVIGQREINKAVEEAIEGSKEVVNG